MKTNTAKTAKNNEYPNEATRKTINDVAAQLKIALTSDETPQAVKDCLKTIIIEAATNAHKPIPDFDYTDHVCEVLPNIIISLGDGYGAGVLHSIAAILLYDTNAFRQFHEAKPETPEQADGAALSELAAQISEVMKHPLLPPKLYSILSDELNHIPDDTDSPEWILSNLKIFSEVKNA